MKWFLVFAMQSVHRDIMLLDAAFVNLTVDHEFMLHLYKDNTAMIMKLTLQVYVGKNVKQAIQMMVLSVVIHLQRKVTAGEWELLIRKYKPNHIQAMAVVSAELQFI